MTYQSFLRQDFNLNYSPFYLYFWCYRLYLQWQGLQSSEKIVIYQMGKVGSTSIWKSLESLELNIPIYHVHRINPDKIKKSFKKAKENFSSLHTIDPEVVHAEYLRSQLDYHRVKKPWKVITLVRDPIAIVISKFFQKQELKTRIGIASEVNPEDLNYEETLEKLLEAFRQKYLQNSTREHPYLWFELELKSNLGCDLFLEPNIREKQYHICAVEKAEILVLKLESMNDCYQAAFQAFLGINNFKLQSKNIRTQKTGGNLYKDFLKRVDLPRSYLDRNYDSKLMKNFYSDLEIEQFYRRWEKRST